MFTSPNIIKAALAPLEATDPVVQTVAKNVRAIIKDLEIETQIPGLSIYFTDFTDADPDSLKYYYTEGCKSLLPSTVIVNARFLLETEAAIRSFGLFDILLNTPYLRNDACMFGLIKRVREDGNVWLENLREFEDGQKSAERSAVDELTMTALFFCAHEIGHLLDDVNAGRYAAFLDPKKPLETRLANAAVKLRRHASEFEAYGFDLPGWEGAVRPGHEVFAEVEKLRGKIENDDLNADWFKKEISADDAAVQLMLRYLKGQPARYRWLLIRGLFAASLYAWYKDLLTFCERMEVPRAGPTPMLSFELMKNPDAYIMSASLFGDFHRCTILRSTLGIQAILAAYEEDGRASEAKGNKSFLGRVYSFWEKLLGEEPPPPPADDGSDARWMFQSAQRHLLLAIHMDTAVKLAYVGASTPWMIRKEQEGGAPQLMLMMYEGIDQSVRRLKDKLATLGRGAEA